MYKDYRRCDKNGYTVVMIADHHKSFDTGSYGLGVYEHIYIAELILGRRLLEGEVVHHMDCNRSNNSPDNLMVLSNPMHTKLHGWMNKNTITPNSGYAERRALGCIRCAYCEIPISYGFQYCSPQCNSYASRGSYKGEKDGEFVDRPSKEVLEQQIKIFPMTTLGIMYGVSDNTVRNWCKNYGIELSGMRSYWAKRRQGKINI